MHPTSIAPLLTLADRYSRLLQLRRVTLWLLLIGYFGFATIFLAARYVILPNIADYRVDIEQALSTSLGLPVSIARIDAHWQGLRPQLGLRGFAVRDTAGRTALTFDNVDAVVSWTSLWHFGLRLHRLDIVAPTLLLRRDASGQIFVAGLPVNAQAQGNDFSDWLLAQEQVAIHDAVIEWNDELRKAPPLALTHLNFQLENSGSRHRFGFTAEPPKAMAARLDVRGDFLGTDLNQFAAWQGQAYAEVDDADLAVWRHWVDYPIELPQGRGGLRLWLDAADGQLTGTTADVALADVQLRLGGQLPMLDIERMSGRLTGKNTSSGFVAAAKKLDLVTRDGLRVAPTDFNLSWSAASDNTPAHGEFTASALDLEVLARLAAYLPFDAGLRAKLVAYAPRGRLPDATLNWTGSFDRLDSYSFKSRFDNLGLAAQGLLPGFAGLSGRLDGNEKGGRLELLGSNAVIDLPAVFSEPRVTLAQFNAAATWQKNDKGILVEIVRGEFQNSDAKAELHGTYQVRPDSLGDIDLSARLSNGDGSAVWRYMPLVVGQDARDWLRGAIVGGRAEEATLRLKGELARFPFADGSGIFEVKGRFNGATLRYAPGWPEIRDIAGIILFEGKRMVVSGDKASIFSVGLSSIRAEISDLDTKTPLLLVSGKAVGATPEFLRFIKASPVGDWIDHFTDDMTAAGNGQLDLKLNLPLANLDKTRVDGVFQFSGNKLVVLPGLPPITEAAGRLTFSGDSMSMSRGRGIFLGAPVTVDLKTTGNGSVQAVADGRADIASLRREFDLSLFAHLSGSAAWRANIGVKKRVPEVRIESNLVGIASSLPPPFNKATLAPLALRIERKPGVDASRDQIGVTVGSDIAATLWRQKQGDAMAIERGILAVGESAPPPDRGLLVVAKVDKFDLDFWRGLVPTTANGATSRPASAALPALPPITLRIKAGEATAYGYQFADLAVNATRDGDNWGAQLNSRDISGALNWRGQGGGRLIARLKQLSMMSSAPTPATPANGASEQLNELPGLDIEVERFTLRGKDFGKVKVSANNRDGQWDAKLDVDNPDGNLTGSGTWQRRSRLPNTQLQFKLTAKSIDKLLTRLGYPDAVRRGTATMEGNVAWNATPFAIDYPSLSGNLKFEAQGGQFNKLEPGAGRLLGILSLQSLPRRLTLDFRDVFSEGFAFDSIAGTAKMTHGVADTQDLKIFGPSAKILMTGQANLVAETQDLRVRVQPAVGESLAVGAMLANPAAGAIAWLAQKILRDPLDKAFAFEYAVTGPWADPKVDKISAPAQAQPQEPGKAN
jgi:uncharacterized protein (TIGR02099 family)